MLGLRAHRCACLLRGLAHGLVEAMPYRKGHQSAWQYSRRRKAGEGSNAHERARRHDPAVSCRTLGVLSFGWTRVDRRQGRPCVPAGPGQRRRVRGNEAMRTTIICTGRSLKGEKPAEAPVMRPTRVRLVINVKTAKILKPTRRSDPPCRRRCWPRPINCL